MSPTVSSPTTTSTDKVLLYASLATAYKAGIYYGQPAQVQVDWGYVQPEHVRTAELGIKSRFFARLAAVRCCGIRHRHP